MTAGSESITNFFTPVSVGAARVDAMRHAHIPMEFKRGILEVVRHENGPEGLLSIGQTINSVAYDPIWRGALRSENPQVSFDKWRRFEASR